MQLEKAAETKADGTKKAFGKEDKRIVYNMQLDLIEEAGDGKVREEVNTDPFPCPFRGDFQFIASISPNNSPSRLPLYFWRCPFFSLAQSDRCSEMPVAVTSHQWQAHR